LNASFPVALPGRLVLHCFSTFSSLHSSFLHLAAFSFLFGVALRMPWRQQLHFCTRTPRNISVRLKLLQEEWEVAI